MRECNCIVPRPRGATPNKPNDDERCVECGLYINPAWTSNDGTMAEFFDRLEESLFPLGVLAATPNDDLRAFHAFRLQAEVREIAGRRRFQHRHLGRDNPREATEEAADFANYMLYSLLADRRRGEREEWPIALSGAADAFRAWRWAVALRGHKHTGFSEGSQDLSAPQDGSPSARR